MPISVEQESKLIALNEKFPKFAPIILDAIQGWKVTDPCSCVYGIVMEYGFNTIFPQPYNKTCLLGAALVFKAINKDLQPLPLDHSEYYFKITTEEHRSISAGFDGRNKPSCGCPIAYSFGCQVRQIINPVKL